jgi:hypothetical protein
VGSIPTPATIDGGVVKSYDVRIKLKDIRNVQFKAKKLCVYIYKITWAPVMRYVAGALHFQISRNIPVKRTARPGLT